MGTLHLATAADPRALTQWATTSLADPATVVVVPGLHSRRLLLQSLERATPDAMNHMGPRVLTMADMRQHLGETVGTDEVLSSAQWGEVVRAALRRAAEAGDAWVKTLIHPRGHIPESVVQKVAQAVAETHQADLEPGEIQSLLSEQFGQETAAGINRLAADVGIRLAAARATTWLAARHSVCGAVSNAPLAAPATRWYFLGLDGALSADGEFQVALGLVEHPDVAEVHIGLWASGDPSAWESETPGQAPLLREVMERAGGRRVVLDSNDRAEWARSLTEWDTPTTPPDLTRVEAPDLSLAVEWTMREVKRRLLAGQPMERLGIIAPQSSPALPLCVEWAHRLGVPLVASAQTRLANAPIMRVVQALLSGASGRWDRETMRTLAGHPVVQLPIPLAAIDRAAATLGPTPTVADWRSRLQLVLGGDSDRHTALGAFDRMVERVMESCPDSPAVPAEWVSRVGTLLRDFQVHRGGMTSGVASSAAEAPPTVRRNGEALNVLWRAWVGWARATEIGGESTRPVSCDEWWAAWGTILHRSSSRLSTYPQRGVWVLDPTHLTAADLDEVWMLDLVEGSWETHRPTRALLNDPSIRRALRLETEDDALAREQLVFQQALAAIGSKGWLVTHAHGEDGRAHAPSSWLQMLSLRHDSIPVVRPTAAALTPRSVEDALCPADSHWMPVTTSITPRAERLPGASIDAIYSPSDLAAYPTCGHRVMLTQAFGGETGSEDEQQASRRLLYRLWRAAQAGGDADTEWGSSHEAAIAPVWQAVHRNADIAAEITVGLRQAVAAAWEALRRQRARMGVDGGPLRTVILDRGVLLGDPRTPLRLQHEDTTWGIRTEVASVERIDDPRCVGPLTKLQGLLIVREITWREEGGDRAMRNAWISGKEIGLPLQAALASQRYGGRVWGWERLSLLTEPPVSTGLWVRDLVPHGTGLAIKPPHKKDPPNPVEAAMTAALAASADRVRAMRAGSYPVTPGFHCGFCPVRRACPSASGPGRAPKQVVVPLARALPVVG